MRYTIFSCLLILLLAACAQGGGQSAAIRYEPPATPGGRMCVLQCRHADEYCSDQCGLKERSCVVDMQSQAIKDYEQYTRDQFLAHAPIELHPSDFERSDHCIEATCRSRCDESYNACFLKCGGSIEAGGSRPLFKIF